MLSVMNDTKWDELRLAMQAIQPSPRWRVLNKNGYVSEWDSEWFYHFRSGGYEDIIYVDIAAESPNHRGLVHAALHQIHVPGEETPEGFRVFGYLKPGQTADYI